MKKTKDLEDVILETLKKADAVERKLWLKEEWRDELDPLSKEFSKACWECRDLAIELEALQCKIDSMQVQLLGSLQGGPMASPCRGLAPKPLENTRGRLTLRAWLKWRVKEAKLTVESFGPIFPEAEQHYEAATQQYESARKYLKIPGSARRY